MSLLPTQRSQPKRDLADYTIFAYGPPKSGKTTWAAGFPNVLFLATESGHNALPVFKVDIDSWSKFIEACKELDTSKHAFKNVAIDTVDNLWGLCRQYICEKHKVEHEADLAYGRGHALIANEFSRVLTRLSMLPLGLVLISHAMSQEISTRTGSYFKSVPSLPDKARKLLLGMSDFIAFFQIEEGTDTEGRAALMRHVRTKPSKFYDAGDRTGRLPDPLPMNYSAFATAFDRAMNETNTATMTTKPETRAQAKGESR